MLGARQEARDPVQPPLQPQVCLPKPRGTRGKASAPHSPASHLWPCPWGASPSPGRARGHCTSGSPRGSPSSWPRSLQLGGRTGGGGAGPLLFSETGTWAQDPLGRWWWWAWAGLPRELGPHPRGRDACNTAPRPPGLLVGPTPLKSQSRPRQPGGPGREDPPTATRTVHWKGYFSLLCTDICRPKAAPVPARDRPVGRLARRPAPAGATCWGGRWGQEGAGCAR